MPNPNPPWTTRNALSGLQKTELGKAHPGSQKPGDLYHNVEHTLRVERFAMQFASRRGLPADKARFLGSVAVMHDWDPSRQAGTPAAVSATLRELETSTDWPRRFGWSHEQHMMALAIIQRTEFPFDDAARTAYIQRIERVNSTENRRFVIEEGPLLAEYADKGSYYSAAPFRSCFAAVQGLVREMAQKGVQGMSVEKMAQMTPTFLGALGLPKAFAHDVAVAEHFGFHDLCFPDVGVALSPHQQARLNAAGKGFQQYAMSVQQGMDPNSAYRAARQAVLQALRGYRG
jgi:hypothetical protein